MLEQVKDMTQERFTGRDARQEMLSHGEEFASYLLQKNPFIKMLAISGSLTNPDSNEHEDVDFFVISTKNRVWECFASCVFYGWLYARKLGKPRTYFCFNYLIDESYANEEISIDEKIAKEMLNLKVVLGKGKFREILKSKGEIERLYPSEYHEALQADGKEIPGGGGRGEFFGVVRPLFVALAKAMELRRKRRHASGKIYSNSRVIRSHFH